MSVQLLRYGSAARRRFLKRGLQCGDIIRHQSEGPRPPLWSKIEVSPYAPIVQGYLPDGFSIGGNILRGSVALLPRGFFGWKVGRVEDITPGSFSLFYMVQPRVEIIVLGTGPRVERVDPNIAKFLKKKGISLEVQDTPNACATFNYLLDEGRPAGAALMPAQNTLED